MPPSLIRLWLIPWARSGLKRMTTPTKPTTSPTVLGKVIGSSRSTSGAMSMLNSGTALSRMAAMPEEMYCSLHEMSTKGRATLIRPTTTNTPTQGRMACQFLGRVFWST